MTSGKGRTLRLRRAALIYRTEWPKRILTLRGQMQGSLIVYDPEGLVQHHIRQGKDDR